jgi:hypothetical protein
VCTVSGTTVSLVSTGTCQLTIDQAGDDFYAAAPQQVVQFQVNPNTVPSAPVAYTQAQAGNGSVTLDVSTPADDGGVPIQGYTATCNPGNHQATGPRPLTVAGLTNGTVYTCSVTANNAVGPSVASSAVELTPALPPTITSAGSTTFTRNAFNTFTVTRTGDPQPTLSVSFGSLPGGVTLDPNTGALSGTPALGSATSYNIQISATNVGGVDTENFTLNVPRFAQSVTFPNPGNQSLGSAAVTLQATAPAGLVYYNVLSPPSICSTPGPGAGTVFLNGVGTCTVTGMHDGNADYEQATSATINFDITAVAPGAPTIVQGQGFNGAVLLTFSPPAFTGGAAVTSYTGTCNPGNHTAQSTNFVNVSVGGLTNGTTYTCTVRAGNSAGQGPESAAVEVTPGVGNLEASTTSHDFGTVAMGTTSAPLTITFTNNGTGPVTVTQVNPSGPPFPVVSHDCASVPAGGSCSAQVVYQPPIGAGGLLSTENATGSIGLNLAGNGSCCLTVMLFGRGEKSLVNHYYGSILRRAPDAPGRDFWTAEALRVQGLGANVNEVWFSMANFFFSSPEYTAFNRDDAGFVTDLYNTFFNRPPDGPGLAFWTGQLSQGMPREVVLVAFMMSNEFVTFTQAIFGNTAARAEVDTVVDFYRGLLARLPDSSGFDFWVQRFRAAQCQGAGAVYAEVEAISSSFALGAEHLGRARTAPQYVGDLYNSFLRRGGDLGGVLFWINEIATSARTRENVRQNFIASAEFSARVDAIVTQGCLP